jgi:two-component system chemotaxis sensor kinase CheA
MELEKIREAFAVESGERLAEMESALLPLDFSGDNAGLINTILRAVHTIKGSAMMLGARRVEGFSHIVESVLVRIRQGEIAGGRHLKNILLKCKDHIARLIRLELSEGRPDGQAESRKALADIRRSEESLLEELRSYLPPTKPDDSDTQPFVPDDERLDLPPMPDPDITGPPFMRQPCMPEEASDDGDFRPPLERSAGGACGDAKSIRVDTGKLDALIDSVGELVIAGYGVANLAEKTGDDNLNLLSSTVSRLTDDIRAISINMRMVPVADAFSHLKRVVYDICAETGKEAYVEVSGQDSELDKNVMEKIIDPLVHIVRNAVDHGIEPSPRRAGLGKPRAGRIGLRAFRDVGGVVVEVSDDGCGIDRKRVLEKAVAMGFIGPDRDVSDKDILDLIFMSGLSTSENVTTVSGRGVGMDVVRNNIDSIRGSVEVESRPGEGTTVRLRLPLTLAIIEGLVVGVSDTRYIIPLEMVEECAEFGGDLAAAVHSGDYIPFRGDTIPYVRLGGYFGRGGGRENGGNPESIVIVRYAGQKAGLVVDVLYGRVKTVIKSLSRVFSDVELFSGASILSEGTVALVIDIPKLLANLTR